jgi:hypothetical protein
MALCSNGVTYFGTGIRHFGSAAYLSAIPYVNGSDICQAGRLRNITAGEGITNDLVGLPSGARHPAAWVMPQKPGALSARNTITGSGGISATAQSGYNIEASISGAGDIPGCDLGLIVSIAATLTASGGISSATAAALASMVATLTGSGDIDGTAAGLADLGALLSGAGSMDADNTALMDIEATIRGYGDLTPEGIRDAVWAALASSINEPGTAGAALLAAGSAGDPWGTPLPGAYAPGSAGALVGALINGLTSEQLTLLLDIWQRLGLDPANPLTTDTTAGTIEAGDVSQTVEEPSTGVAIITRIP